MRFFKSKLQIFLSSAIAILAVAAIAGATTIGTNISTDGTLSVAGNVGVGTSTPAYRLDIDGGFRVGTTTMDSQLVVKPSNGYVGVGTANPRKPLEIAHNTTSDGVDDMLYLAVSYNNGETDVPNGFGPGILFRSSFNPGIWRDSARIAALAENYPNTRTAALVFSTGNNGTLTEKMRVSYTGNVGIGTTSPLAKLSVFGSGSTADASGAINLISSSTVSDWKANWTIGSDLSDQGKFKISSSTVLGSNNQFVIDGNGNVGIGDPNPLTKLQIRVAYDSTVPAALTLVGPQQNEGSSFPQIMSEIRFTSTESAIGNSVTDVAAIKAFATRDFDPNIYGSELVFYTTPDNTAQSLPRLAIKNGGNVGIGTTSPAATLDINGYMKLNKNTSQPVACSASNAGAIALNSSYLGCVCNGSSWINIASSTQACVW